MYSVNVNWPCSRDARSRIACFCAWLARLQASSTASTSTARRTSSLEDVAGVGPKRRRELLKHFGGLHELIRASSDEIAKAPGISKKLAELIYATLHSE